MTQRAEPASHATIATEYWKLYAAFVFTRVNAFRANGERRMRECMGNRENYSLDDVRAVVAYWGKGEPNGHSHKVARSILEERLAELGQLVDLGPKNTHELQPGDILSHFGATLRMVERREHHDPEQPANPIITFTTQCLHLEPNAAMPRHWVEREGGYTIQGNRLAIWWVLGIDPNPVLHDAHVSAYYED